jgi:hypothetical protein
LIVDRASSKNFYVASRRRRINRSKKFCFFKKKSQAPMDLAYGKWDLTKSPIIDLFIIDV